MYSEGPDITPTSDTYFVSNICRISSLKNIMHCVLQHVCMLTTTTPQLEQRVVIYLQKNRVNRQLCTNPATT